MDKRNALHVLVLAILASPVAKAAEPQEPAANIEYSVASLEGDVLASELPRGVEVDWEALAKMTIADVNLDKPSAEDWKKIATSLGKCDLEPQLHFEAPLPPEIALYSFYLVTATGITPLRPAKLCGSVRFSLPEIDDRHYRSPTEGPAYFGALCFEKGPRVLGGMLLITTAPIDPKVATLGPKQSGLKAKKKGNSLIYEWTEPGKEPLTLDWAIEHGTKPLVQYRVDIPGRPSLLYVRWSPDPSQEPCPETADLFVIGEKFQKVASLPICHFRQTLPPPKAR